MNRETKFRAKSVTTNEWHIGYYVQLAGFDYIIPFNSAFRHILDADFENAFEEIDIETLQQFTGLTDKNGIEVYEGCLLNVPETENNVGGIHRVYYNEDRWVTSWIKFAPDNANANKHSLKLRLDRGAFVVTTHSSIKKSDISGKLITNSFIRKNTSELRDKLEDLGYQWATNEDKRAKGDIINCYAQGGNIATYRSLLMSKNYLENEFNAIDCHTNEALFLAICALHSDSDYMQWFTDGKEFLLCDREDWVDMYSVLCSGGRYNYNKNGELDKFQKATVEELIEHFK